MDEHDYTKDADGINPEAKDQVEVVAQLMEATTNRLELQIKRVDSYAKWFTALVTLIVGLVGGYFTYSYKNQIEMNKLEVQERQRFFEINMKSETARSKELRSLERTNWRLEQKLKDQAREFEIAEMKREFEREISELKAELDTLRKGASGTEKPE